MIKNRLLFDGGRVVKNKKNELDRFDFYVISHR